MDDMRKGICALCQHNEIIEAQALEFSGEFSRPYLKAITYSKMPTLNRPQVDMPHGPLYTYTCKQCGYTQWFARDPETIPVDPDHRTRIIEGAPKNGPYR